MSFKKVSILFLISICVLIDQSSAEERFCGEILSKALDMICVNGFNSRIKRNQIAPEYTVGEDYDLPELLDEANFLAKMFGNSNMLTKNRGRRFGIYHECCAKPCTYSQLASYCL